MSESEHLADALTGFLLDEEGGWFASAFTAMGDLTAAQAAKVPAERFNSVWTVVRHMAYWTSFLLFRLRGQEPEGLGEDWAAIEDPASEAAWAEDKQKLADVTRELAALVGTWSDETLEQTYGENRPKHWQVIHGVINHNSYHTNEIISIRHMVGLWMEQT